MTQLGRAAGAEVVNRLLTRRSVPSVALGLPGPDESQLRQMLKLAARVPDHGALEPWRFIVLTGPSREQTSLELSEIYAREKSEMEPSMLVRFKGVMSRLFTFAPAIVLVVSSPRTHALASEREQLLSAGAACMNLLTAVFLMGFHGNWLTGWVTSSLGARKYFGLRDIESFVGVIQIGTAASIPPDRARPNLDEIVTYWE